MKKLLTIVMVSVLGLVFAGCTKVDPTTVDYKYSASVGGTVVYSNGNPAVGFDVTLNVTGSVRSTYRVVTDSSGKFSIVLPCLAKEGISVSAFVSNFVYKGLKYSSTSTSKGSCAAGASITTLSITLKDGVAVD